MLSWIGIVIANVILFLSYEKNYFLYGIFYALVRTFLLDAANISFESKINIIPFLIIFIIYYIIARISFKISERGDNVLWFVLIFNVSFFVLEFVVFFALRQIFGGGI